MYSIIFKNIITVLQPLCPNHLQEFVFPKNQTVFPWIFPSPNEFLYVLLENQLLLPNANSKKFEILILS